MKKALRFLKFSLITVLQLLQLSCSKNVLSELGSKSSDEALLVDAQSAINRQDYQFAIDLITLKMSLDYQQKVNTKQTLAGAYAGKCGLNFLNYLDSISHATTTSAFILVSLPFVGRISDPISCLAALNIMESIGPNASRTTSQNAFTALVGMALMGTATRVYTDNIPANGDGDQDAVGISCTLTDAQMNNVVLGFGFMAQNFSALSSTQLGAGATGLSSLIAKCSSASSGASCVVTSAAAVTSPIRDGLRRLMNTTEYGVGTIVSGGNPATIATACP